MEILILGGGGGGGKGGGNSYTKRTGVLVRMFEKKFSKQYRDPVLLDWLEIFSPLRGTNNKTTHYLLSYFFLPNTLKGTTKAPAVDLL